MIHSIQDTKRFPMKLEATTPTLQIIRSVRMKLSGRTALCGIVNQRCVFNKGNSVWLINRKKRWKK